MYYTTQTWLASFMCWSLAYKFVNFMMVPVQHFFATFQLNAAYTVKTILLTLVTTVFHNMLFVQIFVL